ncbi:aminoacyl-tRNA hydrolase [bacterium]|nr:aminoacyl-tRNA hydrolase [candidate division CSSED10-310 bacterium]
MADESARFEAVVGLGNPGIQYFLSRHNAGFRVLDHLHDRHRGTPWRDEVKGKTAMISMGGRKVTLLKPMTFMNASGESVSRFVERYRLDASNLIVVHDDLDIDSGTVRVKSGGGHGGHNGLRSIIDTLDSNAFARVRIGIGRPERAKNTVDFVLSSPQNDDEEIAFTTAVDQAVAAVEVMVLEKIKSAMDRFNRKKNDGVQD